MVRNGDGNGNWKEKEGEDNGGGGEGKCLGNTALNALETRTGRGWR